MKHLISISKFSINESIEKYIKKEYGGLHEVFKKEILLRMTPNPIEVFRIVDDTLLELLEEYGKFENKWNIQTWAVDIDKLKVNIMLSKSRYRQEQDYTLFSISEHDWEGGKRIDLPETQIVFSLYGDLDRRFENFYRSTIKEKLEPFYSILIGFDSEFVEKYENTSELSQALGKAAVSLITRLNHFSKCQIVGIEVFDNEKSKWFVKPATIDTLKNLESPRIQLSFKFT